MADCFRVLDFKSEIPRFSSFILPLALLDFVLGSPAFKSSAALCIQLISLPPVGIFKNYLCSICLICFLFTVSSTHTHTHTLVLRIICF